MEKKGKRTALKRILALAMVFMMIGMTVCACSFDKDDESAPISSGAEQKTEKKAEEKADADKEKNSPQEASAEEQSSPSDASSEDQSTAAPADNSSKSDSSGGGSSKRTDQNADREDDDDDDDDRDDEDDRGSSNVADIGAGRVRQIVLGRIPGATSGNITEFEREYEDGHILYEGTVSYNGKEYEFAIDGSTGNILEWEID
ncbi:MAG: PepSY domain-containing protein [Firmicutes bacterium]|nr:PepSY domain-containing protein [Bacillota bacterium]